MKTSKWLALIGVLVMPLLATQAQTPAGAPGPLETAPSPAVSPAAADVVRLAEAGTSDDVMLAFIQNSTVIFDLSADQILYLRDIGLSSSVIAGMLSRDNVLRNQQQSYTYDQKLYPPTTPPPAEAAPVTAPAPEPAPPPTPAVVEAPAPVYVTSPPPDVGYFYDSLSPYGSWVQLEGVGWCWQPRVVVVNHAWRPYCDSGHWVFTDAGWFWQSDYSWGWAPFHYGRWELHERCGWVWLPDRVWGPAWVTWRSEGEHCGWAPLPPHAEFDLAFGYRFNGVHVGLDFDFGLRPDHFTFIALRDFHEHDFAHRRLPATEVTQIYNHTTIINNYVVNNNTIVNQGIQVDKVKAATHAEFRKVAIRDVPAGSPIVSNPRATDRPGSVVYRPQLKAPAKPEHIVAQKVDERHPLIQHAPVVPSRTERPAIARNIPSTSIPGTRSPQGQTPGTWPRPAVDRAPAYPQPQPTPKLYRPGASASTPATTPATRATDQAKPAAPAAAPTYRGEPQRQQQSRPSAFGNPSPVSPQYPLRAGTPNPSDSSRAGAPAPNPGTYYPKGYHQAAETRALPPMNARPSEARPQPQPSASPRQSPGSDPGNRSPNGPSRKDQ